MCEISCKKSERLLRKRQKTLEDFFAAHCIFKESLLQGQFENHDIYYHYFSIVRRKMYEINRSHFTNVILNLESLMKLMRTKTFSVQAKTCDLMTLLGLSFAAFHILEL